MPVCPREIATLFIGGSHSGCMENVRNEAAPYGGIGIRSETMFGSSRYYAIPFGRSDSTSRAYKVMGMFPGAVWDSLVLSYIDAPTRTSNADLFIGGPLDKQQYVVSDGLPTYQIHLPREPRFSYYRPPELASTLPEYDTIEYSQKQFRIGDESFMYYEAPDLTAPQILDKLILAYRGENGPLSNTMSHASCVPRGWAT